MEKEKGRKKERKACKEQFFKNTPNFQHGMQNFFNSEGENLKEKT